MDLPKHYSLREDNDDHFIVHDGRSNKPFKVAKKGLHPAHQIKVMKMKKYAEGGDVEGEGFDSGLKPEMRESPPSWGGWIPSDQEMYGSTRPDPWAPMPEAQAPASQPMVEPMPQELPPEAMAQPQQEVPRGTMPLPVPPVPQQQMPSMGGMTGRFEQAIGAAAKAQEQEAQAKAQAYEQHIPIMEKAAQNYQQSMMKLQQQADSLSAGIAEGKVDPNRYWHNLSTGSKFSAVIGALLSGFGVGAAGGTQENLAIKSLHRAIDRDIESQKDSLGRKQSMLSDNFRMQGNLMAAEAATRAQYESLLQGKLNLAAAKSQSPIVKANLEKELLDSRVRMMQYLQPVAKSNAERVINQHLIQYGVMPEEAGTLPDDIRKKLATLPDGRMVPVGSEKNANKGSDVTYRRNVLRSNIKRLKEIVTAAGTFELTGPAEPMMEALINDIATDYAKMVDPESIARPSEVEMAKASFFKPGSLTTQNKTAIQSLDAFEQNADKRALEQYSAIGVPKHFMQSFTAPSKEQMMQQWATTNMNSPDPKVRQKAQAVMKKLGGQ
jgi:hypothetical protein